MRKFVFRMRAVLRHRQIIEDLRLQDLSKVQAELAECDSRIQRIVDQAERTLREWPSSFNLADFAIRERFLDALRIQQEREERIREGIAARVEDARVALTRARQEREMIEKIRDRELLQYQHEMAALEQATVDEIATMRHARTQREARAANQATG